MKKSRFTEAQIIFAIKQNETGTRKDAICRQMGISQATFYNRATGRGKRSMVIWELPNFASFVS